MTDNMSPPSASPSKRARTSLNFASIQSLLDPQIIVTSEVKSAVEELFEKWNISTLPQLSNVFKTNFDILFALVDAGLAYPNVRVIKKALEDKSADPLDILHRKTIGCSSAGLPDHEVNHSTQDLTPLFSTRVGLLPPILVLGSSGSGKTTFAASILANHFFGSNTPFESGKPTFAVYLRGDQIREKTKETSAKERIKKTVLDLICDKCNIEKASINTRLPVDGILKVIIDEVGIQEDAQWVGTKASLDEITRHLQDGLVKNVQLVLAGTGLDRITSSVNSDQDSIKFRMSEWKEEELVWLVQRLGTGEQAANIEMIIKKTPLFLQIGTNSRAAFFLVKAIMKYEGFLERTTLIDHVVNEVAFNYIKSNSLKDLDADQRRTVAREVLRGLQNAENDDPSTTLADQDIKSEDPDIRRACMSLLDTHVQGTKLVQGQNYAISVSPAITIVLTALMGTTASLSSTWAGFENIVALGELQRLFTASTAQVAPAMTLFRSRLAFPSTIHNKLPEKGKRYTIKVPKIARNALLLNGRGAPYGDVISHWRLLQSKHNASLDSSGLTKLNLKSELAKMGVLKPEKYQNGEHIVHRFLTSRLMKQWEQADSAKAATSDCHNVRNAGAPNATRKECTLGPGLTRLMYPMGLLNVEEPPVEIAYDEYECNDHGSFFKEKKEPIKWNPTDAFEHEITIVFCTNKPGFNLGSVPCTDNASAEVSFNLKRQHLDNEGMIVDNGGEMNKMIVKYLSTLVDSEKVHIRFQVCSH